MRGTVIKHIPRGALPAVQCRTRTTRRTHVRAEYIFCSRR